MSKVPGWGAAVSSLSPCSIPAAAAAPAPWARRPARLAASSGEGVAVEEEEEEEDLSAPSESLKVSEETKSERVAAARNTALLHAPQRLLRRRTSTSLICLKPLTAR